MAITLANGTPTDEATTGCIRFVLTDTAITSPVLSPVTSLVITNAQLQTAAAAAGAKVLRRLARVMDDGLSQAGIAAGATTQAVARALFMLNDSAGTTLSASQVPRARTIITNAARTQAGNRARIWGIDASVDGAGRPTLLVTARTTRVTVATDAAPSPGIAYVDIICSTAQGA